MAPQVCFFHELTTSNQYDLTFNDTLSIGLSSAERYDPKTDTWTMIESMSTRRSSVGVGVLCNQLYAVGGKLSLMFEFVQLILFCFVVD